MIPQLQLDLNVDLAKSMKKINALSSQKLQQFAETTVEIAKELVHRITGNLADNIDWDEPGEGEFRVFTRTGYGGYEELRPGTRDGTPHEFMRPAIRQAAQELGVKGFF